MSQEHTTDQEIEAAEQDAEVAENAVAEAEEKAEAEEQKKVYDEDYVKKLRDEAAARRKQLREVQERLEALEAEKLSETERQRIEAEKAKERAEALEARVKKAEIAKAAQELGVTNPELAARLVDASKVELDESGTAVNAADLIDSIVAEFPDLKAKQNADERPADLKKVLDKGEEVVDGERKLSPEAARRLLDSDPEKFNELFDKGLIDEVAN